jgi:DDE superfamily endonuclease
MLCAREQGYSVNKRIHDIINFLGLVGSFSNSMLATVKHPLVLIYNCYGSHFHEEIVARAVQLKIILVLLPSNATHILQPLNVAVFKPFKTTLKRHFESFMIENATTTFSKKDMIQVASSGWLQGVMEKEQTSFMDLRGLEYGLYHSRTCNEGYACSRVEE